ncbi:family 16 glycosylhydrolase [Streptomyces sp. AC495_CC817]|uniref:glycoside hydrolase family 16 protein n=1 Tax=Streptomyces sp. AC495_CC817 TaxID=2823900 RepID=UPI001C281211|nr:family 16 glycosylhydrolase [Streptomyces sp. AC495_CC817]
MVSFQKTFIASLSTAALALSLIGAAPAAAAEQDLPGWTFQEQVDLSDSSRWSVETGQAANTSSYDLPENVSFGSTGLTVRGKEQSRSSADYTSGDAKGLGIKIPNYSRVEAVGSVPFGPGLWPALMWLRPLDSAHGEIDLMEVFGADARVAATLHNEYGPTHRSLQGSSKWQLLPNTDPTGRHTYVMEKTPNRIVISVDGKVILDAGPEDVRPGFDWKAIFERPTATWYPRVTLQIGCPVAEQDCGIGLPAAGWQGGSVKLESLRIWKMADPSTPPPAPKPTPTPTPPVVTPPVVPTPTPTPTPTPPVVKPPVVKPVPPVVVPPVTVPPSTGRPIESGSFGLVPGQEVRHAYDRGQAAGSRATVAFAIPKDIGSGVLYQSLQVLASENGRAGYRATVTLKESGSIRLTVARVVGNRSEVLKDLVVAPRGSYAPGDSVNVTLSVENGSVLARSWVAGTKEPDWQVKAKATKVSGAGKSVVILGYLSQVAPRGVFAGWSSLAARPS